MIIFDANKEREAGFWLGVAIGCVIALLFDSAIILACVGVASLVLSFLWFCEASKF